MDFTFEPDTEFNDPHTLVLYGPHPDPMPHEERRVKLGRVFDRGDFFEGVIYGLSGHAIATTQEEAKRLVLDGAPLLYGRRDACMGAAA